MNSIAKFLFLGTGGSMGIPVIGCHCSVCSSKNPHDKRTRTSALIKTGNQNILIDCGPDYHQQALKFHIETLDGLILTHSHNDHTAGLDELRIYTARSRKSLPCLLSKETAEEIRSRFSYFFHSRSQSQMIVSKVNLSILEKERGDVDFLGLKIRYFTFEQAIMKVNGFRIGNLAYVSDIRTYPETIFEDLADVDFLILSALRYTPSELHFSIDEAIDFSRRVGARKTWLTHIAHEVEHDQANAYLPENIQLAYDGLEFEFHH